MHRSLLAAALALATLPATLPAQIIVGGGGAAPHQPPPTFYFSAWVGYGQNSIVDDGSSASSWDFGSGPQYRATLEYALGSESTLGVAGTYARTPLRYTDTGETPGGCGDCDADATVQSLMALFHLGGRPGFHQVIELGAGIRQYRDFKARATKLTLPPSNDTDFAFAVGYGVGYGLGGTTAIQLVQEYASAIHQREGLPGNARSNSQQYVTRLGMRFGF